MARDDEVLGDQQQMASDFHVQLGDRLVTDLVWRYARPRDDGQRIAGRYAFHNKRCRTEVDGRVLGIRQWAHAGQRARRER